MNPITDPSPDIPELIDGVIFLRLLTAEDAADQLAGEDEDMARWVSGGHSTRANVDAAIQRWQESWRNGGSRRALGVFHCGTGQLIGFVEANLAAPLDPGQANVSYGIFPPWRGQGLALRAINLISNYLRMATEIRQIVVRIAPANTSSLRVAEKGGFTFVGIFDEPEGRLVRYVREIRS